MLIWTALGIVAFLIWAKIEHTWPFGPKVIHEEFLEEQKESTLPRLVWAGGSHPR